MVIGAPIGLRLCRVALGKRADHADGLGGLGADLDALNKGIPHVFTDEREQPPKLCLITQAIPIGKTINLVAK